MIFPENGVKYVYGLALSTNECQTSRFLSVINLLYGAVVSGIDNFAHIGGLIGGCLITMALGVKYKSSTSERVNGIIVTTIFTAFMIYMAFVMR